MECQYRYEHFSSGSGEFDRGFTDYLNRKRSENWCVQSCAYSRDTESDTMRADCIFTGGAAADKTIVS